MHNIQHLNRRSFLRTTGAIAAATIAGPAIAQDRAGASVKPLVSGRRKLGKLEVSSLGLGCQDMTGAVYTSAPNRAEMIAIARTAHDRGVTFFDAAEAYGPLEVERILGEALAPFRNQALRKKATPAQISLAWLLAQEPSVVPIPGSNRLPHLIEDLGADAVRFTPEELRDFNAALARSPVQGARMGRGILSLSGVEAPPKQQ